MPPPNNIPAPIPQRNPLIGTQNRWDDLSRSLPRPGSGLDLVNHAQKARHLAGLSRTPDPSNMQAQQLAKDEQDKQLQEGRLKAYSLDYPENEAEYMKAIVDKDSKWFSVVKPRKLQLKNMLPYKTESHLDQARHLSHIVVYLYIAIKSLDLEGYVHISAKDLANVKTDLQLALDTDLFNADMLSFDADDGDQADGDEEDEEVRSSGVIGKTLPRSATIVSVNHWTNELKSCLKMKFEIPLALRASLAKVFYSVALSRGQDIKVSMFIDMFIELVSGFRNHFDDKKLLRLDHHGLLDYYSQFFPDPDPSFDIYNPLTNDNDKKIFSEVLRLGMYASPFFSDESMQEIFDWSMQRYSVTTGVLSLQVMSHTMPTHFREDSTITDYVKSIFHFWTNTPPLKGRSGENNIIHILNRVVTRAYYLSGRGDPSPMTSNQFGVLTVTHMKFFMHRLLGNLRQEFYNRSYSQIAAVLVCSITPENFDDFFEMFKTLLGSLETYVHPSNLGGWSSEIAKFCFKFIHRYHKRVQDETTADDLNFPEDLKLTKEMNSKISDAFIDILMLGSQSKKESHSNYYVSSLGYLADIHGRTTNKVVDILLIDLYDSLTDQFVNSSHRVIVSLKQFTEIVRFMVLVPAYRVHITNIMSLVVSKLGTNDMSLTNHALNAFLTTCAIIPVLDCTTDDDFFSFESSTIPFIQEHIQFIREQPDQEFVPDVDLMHSAFKASTKLFKEIMTTFISRLLLILETDLNEKFVFKITQSVLVILQSLSEDIFQHLNKIMHDHLLEGDFSKFKNNEAIFANIIAAMVKRDNTLAPKYFGELDNAIRYELDQGAGSVRNNTSDVLNGDIKLVVYLIVLSEVLSVANGEPVKFHHKLLELFRLLYSKVTNPSLSNVIAYVLHKLLKNLTNIKLKENRLFKVEPSKTEALELWGAFQFDDNRFDEKKFEFEWFVPGDDEVHCAIDFFENVILETLGNIEQTIATSGIIDLSATDTFVKDLRFIGAGLSGASTLFDPDFTNDSSGVFNRTALEKKLLILKSLRASKTDTNELNIDIEQITSKESNPEFVPDQELPQLNDDELKDMSIDHLMDGGGITHDDEISSSVLMTPTGTQDVDMASVMNPAIAFAEQKKIYNCGYHFGSTAAEKRESFDYAHIHSLRSMIGKTLHSVYVFLFHHKSQNVAMYVALLQVLRTYFSDVGKESTFDVDDQLFIDFVFMKKVLAAGNHSKPFTRTCFGARAEKFHRQRVILHSTNRFPTTLDRLLIGDLVKLCASPYRTTSEPALLALMEAMRKIIGSYRLIIESLLLDFEKLVSTDDHKSLEAILRVLQLNKVSNKLSSDYQLMERVFGLLDRCLRHKETRVSELAKKQILLMSHGIKVPSAVALFDHSAVDSIRPPDKCIDLEISAVKNAKDEKRKTYIEKLSHFEDFVVGLIKENDHWMHKFMYLSTVTTLQEYYELETKESIMKLILTQATGHPSLIRHCIKSFSKMVDKIMCFALYDYSVEQSFALNFMRPGMVEIDSSENFTERFRSEMKNFDNPSYYHDGRAHVGWLFWGKRFTALSTEKSYDLIKLNEHDQNLLKTFGTMVSKQWLSSVLKAVTIHNESAAVFQISEASLISSVIQLSALGYTSIEYQDILDILGDVYDKDDKASVILCAEIVCGLLVSSNHTRPKEIIKRDEFLDKFLDLALSSNLTPDSRNVWNIVAWWLPSRVDFRRMPVLHKKFSVIKPFIDPSSDQAFVQSSRLMFTKSYLSNLGWQFQDAEAILSDVEFKLPYYVVRQQLGEILALLTYCFMNSSFENCAVFVDANASHDLGYPILDLVPVSLDEKLKLLFKQVELARQDIVSMTPQEAVQSDYFFMATSILDWMRTLFVSPLQQIVVPYTAEYLVPFIMNVESQREMCKIGNIKLEGFVQRFASGLFCRPEQIEDVMGVTTVEYTSPHQLLHQLSFIEGFFNRQLLLLSTDQKLSLLRRIDELLFHQSVEVRSRAASVLSGIIHNTRDLQSVNSFIEKYQKILTKWKPKKELTAERSLKLHGAVMGLGSLISAFPYVSPPPSWMPPQIVLLARACSIAGSPGKSAKDILSQFKKLRADTWHIDRTSFTEEQLADLEGVLWRSYFA